MRRQSRRRLRRLALSSISTMRLCVRVGGMPIWRLIKESECYPGKKIGRLTLIEKTRFWGKNSKWSRGAWKCKCDCGNEPVVRTDQLGFGRNQGTISCGCYSAEFCQNSMTRKLHQKYKESDSRPGTKYYTIYHTWTHIKDRCCNRNCHSYPNYGGRGIHMCDEWLNSYESFKRWYIENGFDESATVLEQSVDRIDVNGDYSPINCRLADVYVQSNNKRSNVYVEFFGEKLTMSQLAQRYGFGSALIRNRVLEGYQNYELICPYSLNPMRPGPVHCNDMAFAKFHQKYSSQLSDVAIANLVRSTKTTTIKKEVC